MYIFICGMWTLLRTLKHIYNAMRVVLYILLFVCIFIHRSALIHCWAYRHESLPSAILIRYCFCLLAAWGSSTVVTSSLPLKAVWLDNNYWSKIVRTRNCLEYTRIWLIRCDNQISLVFYKISALDFAHLYKLTFCLRLSWRNHLLAYKSHKICWSE